ncbi:hypothetical protein D3C73_1115420 [compost metagenome]
MTPASPLAAGTYNPAAMAISTRAAISTVNDDDSAATTLPMANRAIAISSTCLRAMRPVATVVTGDDNASTSVNTITNSAMVGTGSAKSFAMTGSKGAIMKPSVPMANVPKARNPAGSNTVRVSSASVAVMTQLSYKCSLCGREPACQAS